MSSSSPDTQRTMTAVVTRSGGSVDIPDVLVDATVPAPAAPTGHDILVEVKALSVNPVDVKVRAALNHTGGEERILGWDAAGTVIAVGEQTTLFQPGDDVYYAGALERPGSYGQLQLVDERIVGPKPSSLDYASAAALPLTSLTAWEALFDKLHLSRNSAGTILVLGAAGGVGSMVIQLTKALTDVSVIATASREESRDWVRSLGADAVVDHFAEDLAQQVLAIAPDGVDYVFTPQSRGRVPLLTTVVRPFGEIVAIDDERDLDLYALKDKAISWHWEFMFARPRHGYDLITQHHILSTVAELIDSGRIRGTASQTLTPRNAAQIRAAHRLIESGRTVGKIVVTDAG